MNDEVPGYRILQQVGEGGFSLVYRAKQERLDRIVALKVLSVNAVDDATMRRFQRECQITGRLTGHPNVVTVLDTGMTKAGRPYIAMDFFEHGSLRDRLTREGPFPVSDILRIGVKICGALAATHQAEVLHRDVKPQNILVSRYGEPALADFGVARLVDTFEATHTNAFTPHHAAPEVVNGRPPGVSSDIYSLGSTLYQLLAGAPAFKGTTDTGIGPLMLRIINEPPPAINRPDLPPRVFEAIHISMAKEPADRFRTAVDFAARLQQLQSELGLPVTELAGSGALTGPPHTAGPGGPHGSTGPSSGFPGLAGTFPGPGEYVGFPAPGEGVTADPLEHSAFKQLNPGLYPAPAPGAHADVPGGWGPRYGPGAPPAPAQPGRQDQQGQPGQQGRPGQPGQFDNSTPPAPAGAVLPPQLGGAPTQLGDASPTDAVGAPHSGNASPTAQGGAPSPYVEGAPHGNASPTDLVGTPPAQDGAPYPYIEGAPHGAGSPTDLVGAPPAYTEGASHSGIASPTDFVGAPPAQGGAPPQYVEGASPTTLGAMSDTQFEGAPQSSFNGASQAPSYDETSRPTDHTTAAPPNGTPQALLNGETSAPSNDATAAPPNGGASSDVTAAPSRGGGSARPTPDSAPQSRTDATPQPGVGGAPPAGPNGAPPNFDGSPQAQATAPPAPFNGAPSANRDGAPSAYRDAPPTNLDGISPTQLNGAPPAHVGGLPPAPLNGPAGAPPSWGPVAEGGPWLQQQPTQQAPVQQSNQSPAMHHHLAPSPRESTPRTLPPTQDVPPPSDTDDPRGASGGVLLGVLVTVLVILGLGIGGVIILGGGKKAAPKPAPTTSAAPPLASAPPVDPATMNAVRPHTLKVHDAGTLVTLSWQLGKKGKNVPLLIQQSQADQTAKSLPLTVANGTTSAPIAGLDPTAGYCFEVGAIAAFSTKSGQPAAVAWSVPDCIRGAQPQH